MVIGITAIICSIVYLMMITFLYFSKERINNFENKLYVFLILVNFTCLIFELLCCYSVSSLDNSSFINLLLNKTFLIFIATWLTIFSIYIFVVTHNNNRKISLIIQNKIKKYIIVYITLLVIVIALIYVLPIEYYFDGNYVYSFGLSTNVLYFYCTFCVLFSLICSLNNIKYISIKKILPMFIFIICIVIVLLIRY